MNDFDDRIREGRARGPDDPPSAPPFADVERRARRTTRRRRALAGGAVLGTFAVVAGILATQSDEDSQTVVVTQPDSSTTTIEVGTTTTTSSTTTTTTTTTTVPVPPARPSQVVVATNAGRLLVLDVDTGEVVTDLGFFADGEETPGGGPGFAMDVSVTANGELALVSICCEPANGRILAVPTDGSAPAGLGTPSWVTALAARPGPPARPWFALATVDGFVVDADGIPPSEGFTVDVPRSVDDSTRGFAWSPDGRSIAWQESRELVIAEVVDEDDVEVVARLQTPADRYWLHPTFRADGDIVVLHGAVGVDEGEPTFEAAVIDSGTGEVVRTIDLPGAARASRYDATGTWLLVTLFDGRLVVVDDDGRSTTIAEGVTNADWLVPPTGG